MTPERRETLKQVVEDILEGRALASFQVDPQDISMVFMTLALSDSAYLARLGKEVAHIYEYLSKAGQRSINGYPCFFSHSEIMTSELPEFVTMMKAYTEFKKGWAKA